MFLVLVHRDVGAEEDHRNGGQIGFGNTGSAMGDTGTGCFENGRAARDLGVGLGGKGGSAFVAGQNEFDGRGLLPFFVPADGRLAGEAEHTADLVQFQHPQNDLCAVHPCHALSLIVCTCRPPRWHGDGVFCPEAWA